jgi:hypothetical protein
MDAYKFKVKLTFFAKAAGKTRKDMSAVSESSLVML